MSNKINTRCLKLDYLREYILGADPQKVSKDVGLLPGKVRNLEKRVHLFNNDSFGWKAARLLEGRETASEVEGVWPINFWRANRRFGNPGNDVFPEDEPLSNASSTIFTQAKEMRGLGYFRVTNAEDARQLILGGQEVRYSTEITSEWYDPPNGVISVDRESPEIIGSHAVPLSHFVNDGRDYFIFRNSWGNEWGHNGFGAITKSHFDQFIIEAWVSFCHGLFIPIASKHEIVCLEWKWSVSDDFGVHCREIVNAESGERLAWAMCCKRDGWLDVDEFFVWPTERRKGYGLALSKMVCKLAKSMNLPLRMLVSYADVDGDSISGVYAVGKLLDVNVVETDKRWVVMIGTQGATAKRRQMSMPQRPAFMLEWLRPKDEKPMDQRVVYNVVYGTNRAQCEDGDGYSGQRGASLRTGVAQVNVNRSHKFGARGRKWVKFWRWFTEKSPQIVSSRRFISTEEFRTEVSKWTDVLDESCHNLLYVHGYNVSFQSAVEQAACLGVDLKVPGITFLYSWPSAGGVLHYSVDEATIEASVVFFSEFLSHVLEATSGRSLSIVVHSMGNRALVRLIEAITSGEASFDASRIRNVICAAPDVDTDVFRALIPKAVSVGLRPTLYCTRADAALLASNWLHGYSRAGLAPPVVSIPGMDTILVEGFDMLNLAHGYYADAAAVMHDMFMVFHHQSIPERRPGLLRCETNAGDVFWKLQV